MPLAICPPCRVGHVRAARILSHLGQELRTGGNQPPSRTAVGEGMLRDEGHCPETVPTCSSVHRRSTGLSSRIQRKFLFLAHALYIQVSHTAWEQDVGRQTGLLPLGARSGASSTDTDAGLGHPGCSTRCLGGGRRCSTMTLHQSSKRPLETQGF